VRQFVNGRAAAACCACKAAIGCDLAHTAQQYQCLTDSCLCLQVLAVSSWHTTHIQHAVITHEGPYLLEVLLGMLPVSLAHLTASNQHAWVKHALSTLPAGCCVLAPSCSWCPVASQLCDSAIRNCFLACLQLTGRFFACIKQIKRPGSGSKRSLTVHSLALSSSRKYHVLKLQRVRRKVRVQGVQAGPSHTTNSRSSKAVADCSSTWQHT
jgi:hypothetical protein